MENEALILDFLEWISEKPRAYDEVMSTWRTSCPRLTIWEDSIDAGLVELACIGHSANMVQITNAGMKLLSVNKRGSTGQQLPQ